MKTALFAAAALILAAPALAQDAPPPAAAAPFAIQRAPDGALSINLPLPAHAASQMQAAAEQRARDVELGAASVWGTAQADWLIAQLRASGLLSTPAPASAPASAPSPSASAASAPQETASLPPLPPLAPGLDDDTLRHLIALFYESDTEKALQEKTYAFRRDTRHAMKDVLIIAASLYSLGQGAGVNWAQLESKAQSLIDTHGPQITAIFLEGIKAAARARQNAIHDPSGHASQPPAQSVPPDMHHDASQWKKRIPH